MVLKLIYYSIFMTLQDFYGMRYYIEMNWTYKKITKKVLDILDPRSTIYIVYSTFQLYFIC